ncbi:MAG: hypothetical protein WCS27_00620, partial [Victivallaceae bacterium]
MFITEQPERRIVHLLSYLPELRGNTQIVEEPLKLSNVKFSLRQDERKITKIYLAPRKQDLPFTVTDDGYIEVTVPKIDGYAMIVFE